MGMVRRVVFVAVLLSLVVSAGAAISMDLYYTLEDPSSGGSFGARVAGAGDIDGDGYGDLMSADPGHQLHEGNIIYQVGTLVLFSGKDGSVIKELFGSKTTEHNRISVFARAGDVNKDGVEDLVVGSPDNYRFSPIGTGVAWVISGDDWSILHTWYGEGEDDHLGASVAAAGDVNGDGYDDVIIGAPENDGRTGRGRAYVYSGKDGAELYAYEGTQSESEFGYAVGGGVDLDDDGYDDFFIGVPHYEAAGNTYSAGRVRAYSGQDGTHLWDSAPKNFGYRVGWSVDAVPDVNGDGYDDVVAGAPYGRSNDQNTGIAYILSGEDGTVIRTLEPDTSGVNSTFGSSVECIGDASGDGVVDFVVGAPEDGLSPTPSAGAVYVISGKDAKILQTWRGTVSYQRYGLDVAGVGDVNADGLADIACVSSNTRDVYVYATDAPKGTIEIDSGATHVNSRSVTLSLTWSDPSGGTINDMRLRNEGDAWGAWITPAATKAWTLPSGDGEQTVEVQFRNSDGDESAVFSATIYLDETVPVGTILIDAGADFTATPIVPLALSGADLQSGIDAMRLKNDDGEWEEWVSPAGSVSWVLTAGDGSKTVTVQYRDLAGNLSVPAADTVSLDETAPVGTLSINGGATYTGEMNVTLSFDLTEAGSGVAEVRFREGTDVESGEWRPWGTYASTRSWTLEWGDGVKVVEAEARDAVGNTSEVLSTSITLDETPPEVDSLAINQGAPYIAPADPIEFGILLGDNRGGAGVDGFRVSFDAGRTWSDWIAAIDGFQTVTIPRPAATGALRARIVARDAVGHESDPSERPLYVIESELPETGGKGKVKGVISSEHDVDTIAVHLVKGDLLSVKLSAKAWTKGDELLLALDLLAPDGTRLFEGRYPADEKKVSVKGFLAPETGRYLLVVRQDSARSTDLGTYTLTTVVKAAKENRKGKGEVMGDVVVFDAVDGAKLKATLKGEGLTAAGVALHGPDGEVVFTAKEGKGKVTIKSVVLTAGTGTYRLTVPAGTAATFKWSLKPPPKLKAENSD